VTARPIPAVRYPAGPITPHGAYYVLDGRIPIVALRAYDNSIVFNLMGGPSLCDRTIPERVELKDLKGLVPPWKQIDQKGATQDGKTFVTSLYDPAEIEMTVMARGRDPQHTRKVVHDLVASIDAIQTSELSWFTQDMGRWWAPVRWQAAPVDPVDGIQTNRQKLSLRLRGYDAFWRSYDSVNSLGPADGSGFAQFVNVGDQPMWPRFTCFGPGTFSFGDGPNSPNMVQFGPLLAGQVAQIRTDPRKRGVVDLSATPITPQAQETFGQALLDFLSFLSFGLSTDLLGVVQAVFGILGTGQAPPQGNLYSLLKGRFSRPIPARSPGNPVQPYNIAVSMTGGDGVNSMILGAGTPLRRLPY